MVFVYLCTLFKISKNEKTFFLNEQRSMDTAAQKRADTSGVEKSNNYYEEYYKYPHYNNYYFSLLHLY